MKLNERNNQSQQGFSIVEMVVVVGIIGILTGLATISLLAPRKYNAEKQTLFLIDLIREAQQRALSQKKTMRVEINSTDRVISLINENEPADANADGVNDPPTANNDIIIKTMNYVDASVYIGVVPTNMTAAPTELSPVLPITFATSLQPHSLSDIVATMRFRSNGNVLNAGNDAIGTGATPTGVTIYVWTKRDTDNSANPTQANILRALTVLGSSGSAKLWSCGLGTNNECTTWTR